MGTNIPATRAASIAWVSDHIALWTTNAVGIGLTAGEVTALTTLANDAGGAQNAAQIARADSKSATLDYYTRTDAMRDNAADLVATIKAFAEKTNDPNVYVLANVSPKDPPSPLPAPTPPAELITSLVNDGSILIEWKATNPSGTYYVVQRKLDTATSWSNIGDTGGKEFIDGTVPAGTATITYQITPKRGSQTGLPSEQITVQFGSADAAGATELGLAA